MRARRVLLDRLFATCRVAVTLSLAVDISACVSPAVQSGKSDNTIRFATDQTPPNIDPYFNQQGTGAWIAMNVWDGLLDRNPDTGKLLPNLATAWRWIDERTLELDVREGVTFHNGEPFGADDVVYTFTFEADPRNKALRANLREWLDHVEKIDDHKVCRPSQSGRRLRTPRNEYRRQSPYALSGG